MGRSNEIIYYQNSILVVAILFVLILLAYWGGELIGKRYRLKTDSDVKNQTNTIQAGTLGLLALILGFTFNMSLERYNERSLAVIHEANAIGTAMLRTKLLPIPYDSIEYNLLRKYTDQRLEISNSSQVNLSEQQELKAATKMLQTQIWLQAMNATKVDPRPVTTGFFIESLNNMFDAQGRRNALLDLHVPEVILFLLFVVFITAGALMGYSSGLGNKRTTVPAIIMTFMISLVVYIIIDLDRPRRGMIKVSQESMLQLQSDALSEEKPYRLKGSQN